MTAVVVTQGKVKLQKERSTFIYRSRAGSWEQQIYLSGRGAEGRGGRGGSLSTINSCLPFCQRDI